MGTSRFLFTITLMLFVAPLPAAEPLVQTEAPITALTATGGGKLIAFASDSTIQVWQLQPRLHVATFGDHKGDVLGLAFTSDGKTLLSGGADKTLRWWDAKTGKQIHKVDMPGAITRLSFAPGGKVLAVGDSDGSIRLVDAVTGKVSTTLSSHRRAITDLEFAPNGKALASGSSDRTIVLWSLQTQKPQHVLKEHRSWVSGLAYAPDGTSLVSAGRDQRVLLWDVPSGTCFQTFEEWDGAVQALAVHGPIIASAGLGKVIHLRHERLGKEIAQLDSHAEAIGFLAFADAGKLLVSAGKQRIYVHDVSMHRKEGPVRPDHFTAKLLDEVWQDLASPDKAVAVRTVRALSKLPELAVPLLDKRLTPVAPATIQRIHQMIADLDSEQFDVREQATLDLPKLGYLAEEAMRTVLLGNPSLESKRRLERILRDMPNTSLLHDRETHAIDILERLGTEPARGILKKLADGSAKAALTHKAQAALQRLDDK